MEFSDIIKKRYSLRYFDKEKAVPEEAVDQIIEAARLAPTAHNTQSFHIYQLKGEALADVLKDVTSSHFGAPLVLALTMDETTSWKRRDGYNNASIDIGIVGTHIVLMAEHLGLGSCWVGSFDPEALRQLLNLEANEFPAALFMIGYPSERAKAGPLHEKRKSREDLFTIVEF